MKACDDLHQRMQSAPVKAVFLKMRRSIADSEPSPYFETSCRDDGSEYHEAQRASRRSMDAEYSKHSLFGVNRSAASSTG